MKRALQDASMIVVLVALYATATEAQTPSLDDQLKAAEAKWAAKKPKVYEFTFKWLCFCGPIPPGWEPIIFRVVDGTPSRVSGERAFSLRKSLENYNTVEKSFAYIRQELAKHHYRMEVEYEADYGYLKGSVLI